MQGTGEGVAEKKSCEKQKNSSLYFVKNDAFLMGSSTLEVDCFQKPMNAPNRGLGIKQLDVLFSQPLGQVVGF